MADIRTLHKLGDLGALAVQNQAVGVALTVVCLSLSCARKTDSASWDQQHCSCSYVTDFDAPGHVEIQVCAANGDIDGVAQSCAASSGVGAVSECQCRPTGTKCGSQAPCSFVVLDRPPLPR